MLQLQHTGVEAMSFRMDKQGYLGELVLDGDLTHDKADKLKLLLMRALASVDQLVLNLESVKRIDPPCGSLIGSIARISKGMNKSLIIRGRPGSGETSDDITGKA